MEAYVELVPATAVTHAIALPFLRARSEELIIAKTSLLQVFQVRPTAVNKAITRTQNSAVNASRSEPSTTVIEKKLVLVGEYQLAGEITSLARIKALNTKTGGEALLVSFQDAKISLLEWNAEAHALATISIHYYETEDLLGSPWAPDLRECSSYLITDPSSRCAALRFGLRHLALIPFRQPGDDLTMGGYDPAIDEASPAVGPAATTAASFGANSTPYDSSFILLLTELDPNIIHAADLAFLYEYREPTLGVLSATKSPSLSIVTERQDILTYTAFTLDLQQRASTALVSMTGLPSDLFKILPLSLPVGGALLIGGNELVHVDQAGKTHAVGVNEYAKQTSNFPMTDSSDLALRLEGSIASQINSRGDVLLILSSGDFVMVKFRLDGRSVSGFSVKAVSPERGGRQLGTLPSCVARLEDGMLLIGTEQADSVLVQCLPGRPGYGRKRTHGEMKEPDDVPTSEEEIEDEDDLYGDGVGPLKSISNSAAVSGVEDVEFHVVDSLPNLTSIGEPVFGRKRKKLLSRDKGTSNPSNSLELAVATGCGTASKISFISKTASLDESRDLDIGHADRVWTLMQAPDLAEGSPQQVANVKHLLTSGLSEDGAARSEIYTMSGDQFMKPSESYFETEASTLDAGLILNGTRIVQVCPGEVRCYPLDLSFPQIFPMTDEATETDLRVQHSSILDPYVLVIRDNGSCSILKADTKGELDELETGKTLENTTWTSGCLYPPQGSPTSMHAYLLSVDGTLHIYELPDLTTPLCIIEHMSLVPRTVGTGMTYRRSVNREKLVEVLVADLGDEHVRSTHLILRTAKDGIIIYQPYDPVTYNPDAPMENKRWIKVSDFPGVLEAVEDEAEEGEANFRQPLRTVDLGGYLAVYLPRSAPALILKEASSMPRLLRMDDPEIDDVAAFPSPGSERDCIVGNLSIAQLPADTRYGDTGWAVRRVPQNQHVDGLCYHAECDLYAICFNEPRDFRLPEDDDWHPEWAKEDITLRPQTTTGKVRLLDPKSSSIVSEVSIEEDEVILCIKTLNLETSEITHAKRNLVVVGTAVMRGEDQPSNGAIYVYDVVSVVPDPDIPGSDRSLKLLVREEVKGAVTCLTDIGDDGFVLVAQGQKLMVRGLKEDQTLLPVAFLDVQIQVTSLKSVKGTGLALVADALKNTWLIGFASDPYRMRLFGKSRSALQAVAAELLSFDKQLFTVVADTKCDLHVLEFNPEDPKSLSGQLLLNRSTFHTGQFASSMLALPAPSSHEQQYDGDVAMTNGDAGDSGARESILMTTQSGAIALITPLDEQAYRRLGALQNYLNGFLDHPCGLNPKAFRAADSDGFGGRGVLDGQVLTQWHMLSSQRKAEACARVGADADLVGSDLAMISGEGLGYF